MTSRITFLLIAMFWLVMTYLLWRSEYVGHKLVGSSVPVELVWRKILTAPDNSSMEISHQGKKAGSCKWDSNIGQELAIGKILSDDAPPEGMMQTSSGYRLEFHGNVTLADSPGRVRFNSDIKLTTNEMWEEFNAGLNIQHASYKIHSRAKDQTARLEIDDKNQRFERVFSFAELQNPQVLLEEFGLPAALGMLKDLSPLPSAKGDKSILPEMKWTARNDWIAIGHTSVRAYRLEASLLERYRMVIIVSRVGEILRVDLPDGWELTNEQLITL